MSLPCHMRSSRDFLTTGICHVNRTLCLTTNNTPKAWLISCQGLPYTWALVNCSTNTCQSDSGWFITQKEQWWNLQSLELSFSLLHRRSRRCLKNIPTIRSKDWNGSLNFLCFWSHRWNMKIPLSHLINVRSVSELDPSNQHSLAYQLDRHLSPVTSIWGQVWRKWLTSQGQTLLVFGLQ